MMLNMEDSGIDSDCKPGFLRLNRPYVAIPDHDEDQEDVVNDTTLEETIKNCTHPSGISHKEKTDVKRAELLHELNDYLSKPENESDAVCYKGPFKTPKFKSTSILQKRMEKQMIQTRKMRQKEQMFEALPKKLIPRSRLKVPKSQVPLVSKTDSHPLVSWDSDSNDEIDYHPISTSKEISEQLIKDGYNLDLTPDDEDLDLIPPKPLTNKCICCSLNCMCLIQ